MHFIHLRIALRFHGFQFRIQKFFGGIINLQTFNLIKEVDILDDMSICSQIEITGTRSAFGKFIIFLHFHNG